MKKNSFIKVLKIFLFVFLITLIPSSSVKAETNKNFSVSVETDKTEYSYDEVVTYKVTVKNISDKDSKDIKISDELPEEVRIIETDGKIDGQNITWEKDTLKQNEEIIFNLKVKATDKQPVISPTVPNGNNNNNSNNILPSTGQTVSSIFFIIGMITVIVGIYIYKSKGTKSSISLFLAFVFTTSLINFTNLKVYAEDSSLTEEFTHTIKIDNEDITSKILIQATMVKVYGLLDPENPKWNLDSDIDGLADAEEELTGTNPNNPDTDGDELMDKFELEASLDPLKKDTDNNGVLDGDEDGGIGDIAFDWGSHLAALIGFQYSHAKSTENVIDKVVDNYAGSEVYITGHSLGGYLAQKGAYYMNKKENLYNKNLKAAMTFNTEPVIYARYLDSDLFGTDNDDIENYGYRGNNQRYIHNYHIDGDFLYKYAITKFKRKVAGGSKKVFPVLDDELGAFERHSLANFYPYASELNYVR